MASVVRPVIVPGTSLAGTSIEQMSNNINTIRNVCIEIANYSDNYTLEDPQVHTYSGYCLSPPQPTIAKKTAEACAFTKTSDVACGSVGVMTYQIIKRKTSKQYTVGDLAIMFSVPFDYNLFENCFALGIYEGSISCNHDLYNQMYYESGPFTKGKATGSVIAYRGKHALVKGTMSPLGKSIMRVELWDI